MTACIRQTSPTLPWRSFDVRRALEDRLQLPVIYNNDGNAAALYAHHMHFGSAGSEHSSIAAIVGTGLGRRCHGGRAGGQVSVRDGREAWPRTHPDVGSARR